MATTLASSAERDGVSIADSALAHSVTEFVRAIETELLFNHSSRVFPFGALAGRQRGLSFDPDLLHAAAMFHDVALMLEHSGDGVRRKSDTRFGNVKADVIADKEPHFHRGKFCSFMRGSRWAG
jgi:HD superfamily phosphodiesterase